MIIVNLHIQIILLILFEMVFYICSLLKWHDVDYFWWRRKAAHKKLKFFLLFFLNRFNVDSPTATGADSMKGHAVFILIDFDTTVFVSLIQNLFYLQITITMLVPPLMVFLAKHPLVDKFDLSSIKEIWCGAAPLSKELQLAVTKRIGVTSIKQAYGLTETTLAVTHSDVGAAYKYGSCGMVVPGTQMKVNIFSI